MQLLQSKHVISVRRVKIFKSCASSQNIQVFVCRDEKSMYNVGFFETLFCHDVQDQGKKSELTMIFVKTQKCPKFSNNLLKANKAAGAWSPTARIYEHIFLYFVSKTMN